MEEMNRMFIGMHQDILNRVVAAPHAKNITNLALAIIVKDQTFGNGVMHLIQSAACYENQYVHDRALTLLTPVL